MNKSETLKKIKGRYIHGKYILSDVDELKPWGAYYRIDDSFAEMFVAEFFPHSSMKDVGGGGSLSPKFLIFEPGKRLSLQYHNRRAEIWRVLEGELVAAISDDDKEGEWKSYPVDSQISYGAKVRHRAGAPDGGGWVVVAEIWQHTDSDFPTDEEDIIRLADDFGRS